MADQMVQQVRKTSAYEVRECIREGVAKQVGFRHIGLVECRRTGHCSLKYGDDGKTAICMHQVTETVEKNNLR